MYKKIIAGVAAVIMTATSVPLGEVAQILPAFSSISASAEETSDVTLLCSYAKDEHYKAKYANIISIEATDPNDAEKLGTYQTCCDVIASYDNDKNLKEIKIYPDLKEICSVKRSKITRFKIEESLFNDLLSEAGINKSGVTVTLYNGYHYKVNDNGDVEKEDTSFNGFKWDATNKLDNLTQINFNEDRVITKFSDGLFYDMTTLTNVYFDKTNIDTIGSGTFRNTGIQTNSQETSKTTTLDLSKIKSIGDSAFKDCNYPTKLELGNSLTQIGKFAFENCSKLGSGINNTIKVPATLNLMGERVFANNVSLQSIYFEDGCAPQFEKEVFSGCTSLSKVNSNGNNNVNSLPRGCHLVVDEFDEEDDIYIQTSEQNDKILTGDSVFYGCSKLTSFTVPAEFERIPAHMFENSGIQNVEFENNSNCEYICESAFKSSSLNSINFKNDDGTFKCKKLVQICQEAFKECRNLKNIELPQSTKKILYQAFSSCIQLNSVTVSDSLDFWGVSCFENCPLLKLSSYQDKKDLKSNQIIIPKSIDFVSAGCFRYCSYDDGKTGIKDVKFHDNVKLIGSYAFEGCKALKGYDKLKFKNQERPDNIDETSVIKLPDALTEINEGVFKDCTSLETITFSDMLIEIKKEAFRNCTSLKMTVHNSGVPKSGVLADDASFALQIPGKVQKIGDNAFEECKSFKYLSFNKYGKDSQNELNDLTYIGYSAFKNCTSFIGDKTEAQKLDIPEGVTYIYPYTFYGCTNLYGIKFEGDVATVGESAFENCNSLEAVQMNPTISSVLSKAFKNCTMLKDLPKDEAGNSALSNLGVISDEAFNNCYSLKNIEIPASIEEIGEYAFASCYSENENKGLESVTFAKNSKLKSVKNGAFKDCKKLKTIKAEDGYTLPLHLKYIGEYAFSNIAIDSLKLKFVPENVNDVLTFNSNAFENCNKLTEVDLSETNLTETGKYTFSGCENLEKVVLPQTTGTISEGTFDGCVKLNKLNSNQKGLFEIPSNVSRIEGYAFKQNLNMSEINIPAKTEFIDSSCFYFEFEYKKEDIDSGKYNPLKAINVAEDNANFASVDGVLFTKDHETDDYGNDNIKHRSLILYPVMKAGDTVDFNKDPYKDVTVLTSSCFGSNNLIKHIIISEKIETIESRAFNRCQSLTSIDFSGNKNVEIADDAIVDCNPVIYASEDSTAHDKYGDGNQFVNNNKKAAKLSIKQGSQMYISTISTNELKLDAILKDGNGQITTESGLRWASSNEDIATVNDEGYVTFTGKSGEVYITVSTSDGRMSAKIKIVAENKIYLSNCSVELTKSTVVYTGKARTISSDIKLRNGDYELVNGKDYKLSYKDNVNVGTATVTITGIGQYKGTIKKTFRIIPNAPKVNAVPSGTGSVKLAWGRAAGAKGYTVFKLVNGKWQKVGNTAGTSMNVKGLKAGTTYKFVVKAYNGNYNSNLSNVATSATVTNKVGVPSVKRTGLSTVKSSWKKVSGANGYQVQYSSNKSYKGGKLVTVKGTSKTLKATASKKYYVRVRAYKVINGKKYYSAWSSTKVLAAVKKPGKPTVSAKSYSKKTVKVKWKKIKSVSGYQIQLAKTKSFKKSKVVRVSSKSSYKTIKNLARKKKYYVRVRAYKTIGKSRYYGTWSKVKSVRIK